MMYWYDDVSEYLILQDMNTLRKLEMTRARLLVSTVNSVSANSMIQTPKRCT